MKQGIGLMMAKALAENGAAKVYIIGRRENKLNEAAALFPGYAIVQSPRNFSARFLFLHCSSPKLKCC
jgi:NAD(P)-dependent dehydrogenase (short-subunit alcohol dehydrogenase family)